MGLGRNEQCVCGSGRKYKHCCMKLPGLSTGAALAGVPASLTDGPEPRLRLVESLELKGLRYRPLWNKVHVRPAHETFHEFLLCVVQWSFGERWWKRNYRGLDHVVLEWFRAFADATNGTPCETLETPHGPRYAATPSGPARALLTFGYDLFCLQAVNKLPEHLVARLRERERFQAARYEIAVAAIMVRAGFEIEFLDGEKIATKHSEFIATHRTHGLRVAVEAKSRVRPGALHQRGTFVYDGDVKGIVNLIRAAAQQGIEALPLVIFVDVNVPSTPGVGAADKPWTKDFVEAADEMERRASGKDSPFALIVATNTGFHYGPSTGAAPAEFGFVTPKQPLIPLTKAVLDEIVRSVWHYARVPDEV